VEGEAREWLRRHYSLEFFGLHNEAFEAAAQGALVAGFSEAPAESGPGAAPGRWTASCDARLFAKAAGIDTIVSGARGLAAAHSGGESIDLDKIRLGAAVLARFMELW